MHNRRLPLTGAGRAAAFPAEVLGAVGLPPELDPQVGDVEDGRA